MADINIYGVLHAATAEGIIAKAAQIKDDDLNLTQAQINQMVVSGSAYLLKTELDLDVATEYQTLTDSFEDIDAAVKANKNVIFKVAEQSYITATTVVGEANKYTFNLEVPITTSNITNGLTLLHYTVEISKNEDLTVATTYFDPNHLIYGEINNLQVGNNTLVLYGRPSKTYGISAFNSNNFANQFVTNAVIRLVGSNVYLKPISVTATTTGLEFYLPATNDSTLGYKCTWAGMESAYEEDVSTHNVKLTIGAEKVVYNITVDSALNDDSTNPVQNKIIKQEIDSINSSISTISKSVSSLETSVENIDSQITEAIQNQVTDKIGTASGIASLDENGLVPSSQLPSYVDDVLEFANQGAFPKSGETGKIYVAQDTNLTYRWSGSQYIEISKSLALGETSSTAYAGDKGKANRDALNSAPTTVVTNFGDVTPTATNITIAFTNSNKASETNQYSSGDGGTITIPTATTENAGLMSATDKSKLDNFLGTGDIESLGDLIDSVQANTDAIEQINTNIGTPTELTTDSKTLVPAINEHETQLNNLNNTAVKQVKVGSNNATSPISGVVTINNATTAADGAMSKEDKTKVDKLVTSGNGQQFLANDGTYKTVSMNLSEEYAKAQTVQEVAAGDSYETAISKLDKAVSENTTDISTNENNLNTARTSVGLNSNFQLPSLALTNFLAEANSIIACLQALDTKLKETSDTANNLLVWNEVQ